MKQPYNIRVKPITTAPRTPDEPQGRDTFQTPNYATELLIPFIPKHIKWIWEPACGDGRIVKALYASKDRPLVCYQSDIRKSSIIENNIGNFLTDEAPLLFNKKDWAIITNPPYSIKDLFIEKAFEYDVPFAFLINADYSQKTIDWIRRGCEKIIPTSRVAFITPNIVARINEGEQKDFKVIEEIPQELLYKYSSAQFHSMWLCYKFNLGRTETFVDLTVEQRKTNIC